jgi:hypothetical protein
MTGGRHDQGRLHRFAAADGHDASDESPSSDVSGQAHHSLTGPRRTGSSRLFVPRRGSCDSVAESPHEFGDSTPEQRANRIEHVSTGCGMKEAHAHGVFRKRDPGCGAVHQFTLRQSRQAVQGPPTKLGHYLPEAGGEPARQHAGERRRRQPRMNAHKPTAWIAQYCSVHAFRRRRPPRAAGRGRLPGSRRGDRGAKTVAIKSTRPGTSVFDSSHHRYFSGPADAVSHPPKERPCSKE